MKLLPVAWFPKLLLVLGYLVWLPWPLPVAWLVKPLTVARLPWPPRIAWLVKLLLFLGYLGHYQLRGCLSYYPLFGFLSFDLLLGWLSH